MKLLLTNVRLGRARETDPASPSSTSSTSSTGDPLAHDDTLGRGMDIALSIGLFLVIGWLIDRWLGTTPLFTIALIVFAAVGSFVRMKYVYDARMERLEAERRDRSVRSRTTGEAT